MTETQGEQLDDDPAIDDSPFFEANAKAKAKYGRFNLAVVGGTGVGKSSLVNAVFGRDLAKVGKGLPITEGVHYYSDDTLGIWDFEGFEIGSTTSPAESLRQHLGVVAQRSNEEQIAVVWFCVNSTADRLTRADIDMIRELDDAGLPVMLVLTKVEWDRTIAGSFKPPHGVQAFKDWLDEPIDSDERPVDIPLQGVVLTSTQTKNGKGPGHGLGDLLTQTLELSPDNAKDAFRVAQKLNLPWKRQMARSVIAAASTGAAAAAAIPIPVADAVTLAPIQLAMMGRVSAIYDLDFKTMMSVSAAAQMSAQLAGRALARSFIKLIPGVGSVVNASVAAALTLAAGEGWLRLCEQVRVGKVDLSKIDEAWRDFSPTVVSVIKHLVTQQAAHPKKS
ncbi:50S ribosome-binding GTPase [Curtobacterium sp. MCLR17_036]|uniref:GTPase family protein n=1 Tax=Curtobacterium sp. MCLR17_036 TaxID=2175620 RepID=UPI000DAA261E|nr:GTPase [Curtobacterium sp. MCLR17_036]WIE66200.1 50S ribosome-binding GTPase [Curtobacterium sp. MCLR17_036]